MQKAWLKIRRDRTPEQLNNDQSRSCTDERKLSASSGARHENPAVGHGKLSTCRRSGQKPWDQVLGVVLKRTATSLLANRLVQALPVFAAMAVAAVDTLPSSSGADWPVFARQLWLTTTVMAPLLFAHLAACRQSAILACLTWLAGFLLYPGALQIFGIGSFLPIKYWALAAGFSLIFLLLHPQARDPSRQDAFGGATFHRLPITLDGVVAALLALWALAATSLFASTPDAVRNQPLRVWLNIERIASYPAEAISYLGQFAFMALLLFAWYWTCRYVLVRKILRQLGVVPFGFATIVLAAIGTPLAAGAVLLLPLNIPEWTLLPSENHSPFDPANFRFALWLTAVLLPLILVIERLLAERGEAGERHEAVRAELHLLQQQINPHFLFNTLNTLYSLCLRDRAEGAEAIVKLSDLLRYVVYQGNAERVALKDEIDYIENYLDLQMLRFGHRCHLVCDWPADGPSCNLPPLLLIMLVENAFKHGVEPAEGVCKLRICLTITDRRLQFECLNSVSITNIAREPGLGLVNLRRRLELIYGEAFMFESGRVGNMWLSRLELDLWQC